MCRRDPAVTRCGASSRLAREAEIAGRDADGREAARSELVADEATQAEVARRSIERDRKRQSRSHEPPWRADPEACRACRCCRGGVERARWRAPAADAAAPAQPAPPQPAHTAVIESRTEFLHDPLAEIRDDVDEQVLPIFLEEAAELYPQAGEQVRAWRRAPDDARARAATAAHAAHVQGQRAHGRRDAPGRARALMESRLTSTTRSAPATPELFEALDADLDRIGFVLDALREGKTNVALPGAARARRVAGRRPPRRCRGGRRRRANRTVVPRSTVVVPTRCAGARRRADACRGRSRRPRDASRARRHHRPARQRGRRSRDHAGAHRKRVARA